MEKKREKGCHVTEWLPHGEEQVVPAQASRSEGALRFVNRVSVADEIKTGKGAVDIKLTR